MILGKRVKSQGGGVSEEEHDFIIGPYEVGMRVFHIALWCNTST